MPYSILQINDCRLFCRLYSTRFDNFTNRKLWCFVIVNTCSWRLENQFLCRVFKWWIEWSLENSNSIYCWINSFTMFKFFNLSCIRITNKIIREFYQCRFSYKWHFWKFRIDQLPNNFMHAKNSKLS